MRGGARTLLVILGISNFLSAVAAAFFVVSVAALTARRQWLVRVGPVEASERVADFDGEVRLMSESLENALQTIDSRRYELALSNSLLDKGMENSGEAK
jgi:predicted LPLAT superfamily acyltransferase